LSTKKRFRYSVAAKAAGLKSSLAVDTDRTVMTSFGHGNAAILEKEIVDGEISVLNIENPAFDAVINDKKYALTGHHAGVHALVDQPQNRSDAVHIRGALEKKYFGDTFADNIHVQIAYNILDITKILTVYANNVVYALNNLVHADDDTQADELDSLGNFSAGTSYAKSKSKSKSKQQDFVELFIKKKEIHGYFGDTFAFLDKRIADADKEKQVYAMLACLGSLRQACSHYRIRYSVNGKNVDADADTWLFSSAQLDQTDPLFSEMLNRIYSHKIKTVNQNFFENNRKANFPILKKMYPETTLKVLMNEYYDFSIRKGYKNFGFSIKSLREALLSPQYESLIGVQIKDNKEYDTVRSKLYQLFDFALTRYFNQHPDMVDAFVVELRSLAKDEDAKNAVYEKYAKAVWNDVKQPIAVMLSYMNGSAIKNIKAFELKPDQKELNGIMNSNALDVPHFCKLVYFLTRFLDGKEINDLLTTLVNKFDNIHSFNQVLTALGLSASYEADYKIFEDSGRVVEYLREINSFARMTVDMEKIKRSAYKKALLILGSSKYSDEDLDARVDEMLGVDYNQNGEKIKVRVDTGFRNFIANNVVESSRFHYLIRYCHPRKIRNLAGNAALIEYQLRRLPELQILRYYEACTEPIKRTARTMDEKIGTLIDLIVKMDFSQFEDVQQNDRVRVFSDAEKKEKIRKMREKQRYQSIISLYLTMLYLIVKNLVNINARYVMAFQAWERDNYLLLQLSGKEAEAEYLNLTRHFIEPLDGAKPYLKKRPVEYLKKDMAMVGNSSIRHFRNATVHLNVIMEAHRYTKDIKYIGSYYALYHYILQRHLLDKIEEDSYAEKTVSEKLWESQISQYGTYSKDFVKALCCPFGYNLPRFKNLSIEQLFDRNESKEITDATAPRQ